MQLSKKIEREDGMAQNATMYNVWPTQETGCKLLGTECVAYM